ncbi:MAG TPA: PQQ-dependent sugar dehydrogenase [Chitinophagaceae bacterium]|nr:PQQ-dependent sugar dehydrogenase [Chitinophagaceae bacterium]
MLTRNFIIALTALTLIVSSSSCHTGEQADKNGISTDSAAITAGAEIFHQNCSGCHNFRQNGIGPQLSGVTDVVSKEWLMRFIKNSEEVIASGDKYANELFTAYKKAVMPSFDTLGDDQLNAVIAFINSHKATGQTSKKDDGALANPYPMPIAVSGLTVNIQPVAQFPPTASKPPLARITKLGFQPVTGTLFVNDLQGKLYKMKGNKPMVYLDIAKLRPKFINQPGLATGLGSFAFHPDFATNGIFYTSHSEARGSTRADFNYADTIKVAMQWVLTEWKTNDPNADTFTGTSREVLRINVVTGIHGMQEITFNPLAKPGDKDYGLLYIGMGDGGCVEEGHGFLAHSKEKIWGTVLRIDPMGHNSANGRYGIPAGNPFVQNSNSKTVKEIYAYGFRNPERITWNKQGDMLVFNIGQASIESVNLVKPGNDYGWPIREGHFVSAGINGNVGSVYPLPANDSIYHITYPVAEYDHDEGNAICGGYEYWGNTIPALKGKFLFGDIPTGRLFYTNIADMKQGKLATIKEWKITLGNKPVTLKEICGSGRVDLHFGRDMEGELYILTKADGKIYKLTGATESK